MHSKYPRVFSPVKLGPVELRNRFYFSPHGVELTLGGKPSNDYLAYQEERVRDGGCGLVICSMAVTDRGRVTQLAPFPKDNIAAFRALADTIHKHGGKIFGQIWYWWGTHGSWQPQSPPAPALSPSTSQYGYMDKSVSSHEMGKDEIARVIDSFRQSTANLRESGFDGIMLHGSHGGMIEQFLSPYFNRRDDEYGGTFEKRMRFLLEVLAATREAAGGKMAVGMRLNCHELISGGYDTAYAYDVLKKVAGDKLLDFVDLDVAIEPNQLHLGMPTYFLQPQVYRPYVEAVRGAAGDVPVLSVLGRITSMADAEAALTSGVCDVIGAARELIAEPEFVKNAFHGQEDQSRKCLSFNWCLSASLDGAQGCGLNPASYRERFWGVKTFSPAPVKSKVVVVGGGPGGLEAARVCALRGHQVTLMEARANLGGGLALWASLPGREWLRNGPAWWERELSRLGVNIRLNTEATQESVLSEKPDGVIIATGARFSREGRSWHLDLPIPGHDQEFVYTPEDILLRGVRPKGKVILLDGEGLNASTGTAEVMALAGADVEYMTPRFSPVSSRVVATEEMTFIVKRLHAAGVKLSGAAYIRRIGNRQVTVYDVYSEQERTIDNVAAVVLSTGRIPSNSLAKALDGKVNQLFSIGDALAVRPLAAATYEAQKFARLIGEKDAPRTFTEAFFQKNPPEFVRLAADAM